MGLFSIFQKNKQEGAGQDSGYYSKADDGATLERARSKRASSAEGSAARRSRSGRESDDAVLPEKKRARRRLVGAIALALMVAVGLPMLLDSEPKPLASDIAIQIPSKEKPAGTAPEVRAPAPESRVAAAEALDQSEEIVKDAAPVKPALPVPVPAPAAAPALAAAPAAKPAAVNSQPAVPAVAERKPAATTAPHVAELKPHEPPKAREPAKDAAREAAKLAEAKAAEAKAAEARLARLAKEAKAEAKPEARKPELHAEARKPEPEAKPAKSVDAARAMAILEDKPSDTRYMVQVAAVTSQEKVDELQGKLKEAGIQSFTQKVTTASGALTRIRVGPFANKEEAEKVRAKLGRIGLSSSLATS